MEERKLLPLLRVARERNVILVLQQGRKRNVGKMELTDEERKRRSDAAKKLHAEGKIGGKQEGAGRPSGRAQAQVAEAVREDAPKIIAALRSALKAEAPSIRLKAALAMLEIEGKEDDRQRQAMKERYEQMNREEMMKLISKRLQQLEKLGVDLSVVESTAQEIPDEKLLNG